MLHGRRIDLRARSEEDVEILHTDLLDDVQGHARWDGRPWRPHPHGALSPLAPKEPAPDVALFTVVLRDGGDLLGASILWGIDTYNRSAHIGIALRPLYHGLGYGTEVVEVLCYYGFSVLGLHRLQIETLADNAAMIGAASSCGFQPEGTLRSSSWVDGRFVDDVVFGLLADEWATRTGSTASHS